MAKTILHSFFETRCRKKTQDWDVKEINIRPLRSDFWSGDNNTEWCTKSETHMLYVDRVTDYFGIRKRLSSIFAVKGGHGEHCF